MASEIFRLKIEYGYAIRMKHKSMKTRIFKRKNPKNIKI